MEKEPLFAQERQKEILALLEAEQKVLVLSLIHILKTVARLLDMDVDVFA